MSGNDENHEATARHAGDYRFGKRIAEHDGIVTWLAEQLSVGRLVIIDELIDPGPENREPFLADTRARAAVDHPYIASVYEAVDGQDRCYRASEHLAGQSLRDMLDGGSTMEPVHLTRALRCIAEANLNHETHGRPTRPISPEHIHVDGKHVTRIANLATTGRRNDGESGRDVAALGRDLVPLVPKGRPGATRVLTVLAWMRGEQRASPLGWQEIINLCDQIEHQLRTPVGSQTGGKRPENPVRGAWMLLGGGSLAVIAVILLSTLLLRPSSPQPEVIDRPPPVLIPQGEHPTHDGRTVSHNAFLIDARETTIAEYHEFLETLEVLASDDHHRTFDHPDQPDEKSGHEPDDWDALLSAARARGEWNGHPVSLDSPVPGIDWWDATAYANWRKARLPTQEEWAAAIHHKTKNPADIPPGGWHPGIPANCPDRTDAGVHGVAGSLAEWTREPAIDPTNPLGRPQHVIVGGSHLDRDSDALAREWVADPSLRRPDLGFRLVRDVPE